MNCVDCEYAVHLIDKRINYLKSFGAVAQRDAHFEILNLRDLMKVLTIKDKVKILNKRGF